MPHNKIPFTPPYRDPDKIKKIIVDNDGTGSDINADKLNDKHKDYYLTSEELNNLLSNKIFNRLYLGLGSRVLFPFTEYKSPVFPTIELSSPLFTEAFKGKVIRVHVTVKYNNVIVLDKDYKTSDLTKIIIPESTYSLPGEYIVEFEEFTEHHRFTNNNPITLYVDDTNNDIKIPYVTIVGNKDFAPVDLTINTSSFINLATPDTHHATDWEIIDEYNKVVWASYLDKVNLTSITIDSNILRKNRDYTINVKHYGTKAASNVGSLDIKTEYKNYVGTWGSTSNMLTNRVGHVLALLESGDVLALGGKNDIGNVLDTVEKYNIRNGSWSYYKSLPAALTDGHSGTLRNGDVFIVGGENTLGPNNNAFIFNVEEERWYVINNIEDLPLKSSGVLERLVNTDKDYSKTVFLYTSGRKAYEQPIAGEMSTVLLIVEKNDNGYSVTVKPFITTNTNKYNVASSMVKDDSVLLTGGTTVFDNPTFISTESLNYQPPADIENEGIWSLYTDIPIPLYAHAQILLEDFSILVTGGRTTTETSDKVFVGELNGQTITWTQKSSLPIGLQRQTGILLKDGRALLTGGVTVNNAVTNVCLLYT